VRFGVNREHDQAQFALAVISHGFVDGGTAVGTKLLVSGAVVFFAIVVKRVPTTDFGMGMDVDGNQVLVFHGRLRWFDQL
jgi:hypothetical protein